MNILLKEQAKSQSLSTSAIIVLANLAGVLASLFAGYFLSRDIGFPHSKTGFFGVEKAGCPWL